MGAVIWIHRNVIGALVWVLRNVFRVVVRVLRNLVGEAQLLPEGDNFPPGIPCCRSIWLEAEDSNNVRGI